MDEVAVDRATLDVGFDDRVPARKLLLSGVQNEAVDLREPLNLFNVSLYGDDEAAALRDTALSCAVDRLGVFG